MTPISLFNEAASRGFYPNLFTDLWKTQLEEWPDSIHLTAKFVVYELVEIENRPSFLHAVVRSLLIPGFFYACGKKDNGDYEWMGYRYGVEPQEYLSGFFCEVSAQLVKLLEE